jgi:hypothetical protein
MKPSPCAVHALHQSLHLIFKSMLMIGIFAVTGFSAKMTIVDDCEHGRYINRLTGPWYVMDDSPIHPYFGGDYDSIHDVFLDSLKGGNSQITNVPIKNGKYGPFAMAAGEGNPNGTARYSARINFKMGDTMPYATATRKYPCWVGIGTLLATPKSKVLNLSGATQITFWAKAATPKDSMVVRFVVLTDQGRFRLFSTFYEHRFLVTGTWQRYFVTLDMDQANGLAQPSWAVNNPPEHPLDTIQQSVLPLDISKTFAVQWIVDVAYNKLLDSSSGSLWVDDIQIQNYTYIPDDFCASCVSSQNSVSPTNALLLSDGGAKNSFGFPWLVFNDIEKRKVTKPIEEYTLLDPQSVSTGSTPDQLTLILGNNTGFPYDTAASIRATFGPWFNKKFTSGQTADTFIVQPYSGVGQSLSNPADTNAAYNATADTIAGISFKYMTGYDNSPRPEYVRVIIAGKQSNEFKQSDTWFYVSLPGTDSTWEYAKIPFDSLRLNPWNTADAAAKFKADALQKILWIIEGDSNQSAILYIDSVYLYRVVNTNVVTGNMGQAKPAVIMKMQGHGLKVTLPSTVSAALLEVLSLQGRVIGAEIVINSRQANFVSFRHSGMSSGPCIVRLRDLQTGSLLSINRFVYMP